MKSFTGSYGGFAAIAGISTCVEVLPNRNVCPSAVARATSLLPGGRFAWNAFVFDPHVAVRLDGQPQQQPVPHTVRYAYGDNRVDLITTDGATSSLWWATKNEWLGLIEVAGLTLEALYGGFAGEPFGDDSREYVFVARN